MKLVRPVQSRAFTIMELLVVIGIMILVAGLVVGLAGVASKRKKISLANAERDRLVMLIESSRAKIGVYPPQNPNPNNLGKNTLFYELAGAVRTGPAGNPIYVNNNGPLAFNIDSNTLYAEFAIPGIINSSDDPTEVKRLLKSVRPGQVATLSANVYSLVVPIDGPNGQPNQWRYLVNTNAVGTNDFHNKEGFDLWVDIVSGDDTHRIGNWKD
jgi:type II secretory pathway pseudopilin PulG